MWLEWVLYCMHNILAIKYFTKKINIIDYLTI